MLEWILILLGQNALGYLLFLFAGLFFGLFGSGGSIIMLPILVYIFQLPFEVAKIYSLLLIFLIAFIGTIQHYKAKNLNLKKTLFFIFPTLIFTAFSTLFLFPKIPLEITFFNIVYPKQSFLMIIFSIVIFSSAFSILLSKSIKMKYHSNIILIFTGILVGVLTGLLGIGGGFIIVPALILFANMNMKQAASSALFIIMLNTLLAIPLAVGTLQHFQLNLSNNIIIGSGMTTPFQLEFIAFLLVSGVLGIIIGIKILNRIDVNVTKKMFSITLLLLSLVIFFIELL